MASDEKVIGKKVSVSSEIRTRQGRSYNTNVSVLHKSRGVYVCGGRKGLKLRRASYCFNYVDNECIRTN
jgi:hypothetical protein